MIIDTSVLIDYLRQSNKEKTVFVQLVQASLNIRISLITLSELYAGKSVWQSKKVQKELETILSGLEVLPVSTEIARQAGKLRAIYGLDLIDALIAATAILNQESLATLNSKHFRVVPELVLHQI
jgi:tRNA(fMet)-specific endonuclease VapC